MSKLVLVPCFLVITVLANLCRSHAIPLARQTDEDGQNLVTLTVGPICQLPMKTGMCKADMKRFYYDADTKTCKSFTYGGCGGNGNNFETMEECIGKCMGIIAPLDQCTGEGCKCPPGSTGIQPFCQEISSTGEDSNRGPLFIPYAPPPPPPTPAINDTDAIGRLTNEFDDLKDDLTARISSLFSIIARLKIGKSKFCNGRSCQMCGMCQVYQQYGKSESPSFCKRSGEFTRKCGKCTRRCSRSSYQGRSGSIY